MERTTIFPRASMSFFLTPDARSFSRGIPKVLAALSALMLLVGVMNTASVQASVAYPESHDGVEASRVSSTAAGMLLDQQPGAVAAYGLRRLSSSYSGPALRLRRASDNAERDFGFTPAGDLDVKAIESWLGTADAFVVTWYDQGGKGLHASSSVANQQPQFASNGKVFVDDRGLPRIKFLDRPRPELNTYLASPATASISTRDLYVAVLGENLAPDRQSVLVTAAAPNSWGSRYFQISVSNDKHRVYVGDGSNSLNTVVDAMYSHRSIWTFNSEGNIVSAFRNNQLKRRWSNSYGSTIASQIIIGTEPKGYMGGMYGYVEELVLYKAISEAQRNLVHENINSYWGVAPLGVNNNTILPQDWQYQVDLYNWLKTLTVADLEVNPTPLQWDGSYESEDQLANLWLSLGNIPVPQAATRGKACWFVLNDGKGCGIEATGAVRLYYKDDASNSGAFGSDPAFWYQLDVPLRNGGQGNYYYKNAAVARRALVITAVEMMMWDAALFSTPAVDRNDYYGKALSSWAYAYHFTKEILDEKTRRAFEAGMERFLDRTILKGAQDVNTNMDMFFIRGAALVYKTTDNPVLKNKALQAARRVLFGYPDGALGVRHDALEGAFFPAGYIAEADGPETTYNGHSLYNLVGALSWVHDQPEWAFLEEVVRRMVRFKLYQYFKDPAVAGKKPFYEGPAGYANRTGGSYVRDQGNEAYRDLTAAALIEDAHPLAFNYSFSRDLIESPESMAKVITQRITSINSKGFANIDGSTPPFFIAYSSWPPDLAYLPPSGWYTNLRSLLNRKDASTLPPFDRKGYYFSEAFGGMPTGNEFWAYKNNDGTQDFGFFIEADAHQGGYSGWYGGKLEAFWTEKTGLLVLNRHDKTGCNAKDKENTTCWDQIDYWGANHVWGKDENKKSFSTVHIRGREVNRTSRIEPSAPVPFAEVINQFNIGANESHSGEETGSELDGKVSITNRFEAISNGIRAIHTVTSDKADQVSELWATIPVYLKYNTSAQGGQADLPDATIEYWDGTSWRPLTTSLVSTTKLRLGRDYLDGVGPRYGYVGFYAEDGKTLTAQRVKLSSQVWEQSYQGYARIRNVHIDLHGNPGTVRQMPEMASVTYTITTTDPGNSAPPVSGSQTIELKAGWNLISRYVGPAEASFESLLAGVHDKVVLVKDADGKVYAPAHGINDIGTWKVYEGYQILVNAPCTVTISGAPIAPKSVTLQKGWNMIAYPYATPKPLTGVLSSILSDVEVVQDGSGKVYLPSKGTNTIGDMRPGLGYSVYVSRDVTLDFSAAK